MTQINGTSDQNLAGQVGAMGEEIGRLRKLCLKLLEERTDGKALTISQSEELKISLQGAWAELERKQGYLADALQENADLRNQLTGSAPSSEVEVLKASLQEAWDELGRKQGYLETAYTDSKALADELAALRARHGASA
jgi:hypothetical protein